MNIRFDPTIAALPATLNPEALRKALCDIYCNDPERRTATITLPYAKEAELVIQQAKAENIIDNAEHRDDEILLTTSRQTFWQSPQPWLKAPASSETPLQYMESNGTRHPVRPTNTEGTIYERHFPQIDMTFSLRTADPDADSEVFSAWMNLDRVAHFWDQRGTRAEHAAYLAERRNDPHMHPMIGYFDDHPFGYFEFYWAKEDRLGPFYDAGDFDRGLHLLIGDAQFQSAGKLKAWWSGVLHYMFIDDPRTERLVGEPRVDHVRHIAFMHRMGFYTLKEFDFPHKRAALTVIERKKFFDDFRF
ncbi:siderophore biosynthesis protein domain protein [Caballeronia cordobensis]|uniref:Siderophore biosynthesis protein domain protein n=1 Tax=Caballeronia cordobensis TaxID=1353886 RepID=A0A158GZD0_CABCO|nr:GNAT family N-acetyltransferase [Caballeronia cordobensis]SAL36949.1 siderophore biosynthesis protein domain protein [Caballeronia cordobensis]